MRTRRSPSRALAANSSLGQQGESWKMTRPNHPEIAVESRNSVCLEPLRDSNDAGVDHAERKIAVPLDQLGNAYPVTGLQVRHFDVSASEGPEERHLGVSSHTAADKLTHLGHEWRGDEPRRLCVDKHFKLGDLSIGG